MRQWLNDSWLLVLVLLAFGYWFWHVQMRPDIAKAKKDHQRGKDHDYLRSTGVDMSHLRACDDDSCSYPKPHAHPR